MLLGSDLKKTDLQNTIFRNRSPGDEQRFINWNMLVLNMEDELAEKIDG